MEISTSIGLAFNGYTFARISKCRLYAPHKTFNGIEMTFGLVIIGSVISAIFAPQRAPIDTTAATPAPAYKVLSTTPYTHVSLKNNTS